MQADPEALQPIELDDRVRDANVRHRIAASYLLLVAVLEQGQHPTRKFERNQPIVGDVRLFAEHTFVERA